MIFQGGYNYQGLIIYESIECNILIFKTRVKDLQNHSPKNMNIEVISWDIEAFWWIVDINLEKLPQILVNVLPNLVKLLIISENVPQISEDVPCFSEYVLQILENVEVILESV